MLPNMSPRRINLCQLSPLRSEIRMSKSDTNLKHEIQDNLIRQFF